MLHFGIQNFMYVTFALIVLFYLCALSLDFYGSQRTEIGQYDAIVLALAGINRLKINRKDILPMPIEICVPAPGQGALGIQALSTRNSLCQLLKGGNH